jgi:hypothetical protein
MVAVWVGSAGPVDAVPVVPVGWGSSEISLISLLDSVGEVLLMN